jgi:hypothetical protein
LMHGIILQVLLSALFSGHDSLDDR